MPAKYIFLFILFLAASKSQSQTKKDEFSKQFAEQFTKKLSDSIPSVGSFIVSKNGQIIYEKYFDGAGKDSLFDVKSVTKSITSVLAGIARDKGLLPDLNTPVLKILPEYDVSRSRLKNIYEIRGKQQMDSIRKTVTLKDLLTMRGGFQWKENGGETALAQFYSSDPVRFVLDLPFEEYPGDKFNYSTGEAQVFGAALSKTINSSLEDFAEKNLFQPLGIINFDWKTDVLGRSLAGSELFLKPRDMLKIGNLILNKGKFGKHQIVSEKWIEESTAEQVKLDSWDVLPDANGYGYYWWRRKIIGNQGFVAVGYGGQIICIVPDLRMVVVTTCYFGSKNRGRLELKKLHLFIEEVTKLYSK